MLRQDPVISYQFTVYDVGRIQGSENGGGTYDDSIEIRESRRAYTQIQIWARSPIAIKRRAFLIRNLKRRSERNLEARRAH